MESMNPPDWYLGTMDGGWARKGGRGNVRAERRREWRGRSEEEERGREGGDRRRWKNTGETEGKRKEKLETETMRKCTDIY